MDAMNITAAAPSEAAGDARGRSAADLLIPVALIWLWLSLITPPLPYPRGASALDVSWQMCNNYFLLHRFQAGVDFVFPTTLLGLFCGTLCTPALFWPYWLWQIGLASLLTANLWSLASRYPRSGAQLALLFIAGFGLQMSLDATYYVLLISCAAMLYYPASHRPYRLVLNLAAMTLLALAKFSLLMLAGEILLVGAAFSLVQGRAECRRWLLVTLTFGAIWLFVWLLLGQRLGNIPIMLRNLLAITLGYNNAMGLPGDRMITAVSVLVLALLGGALLGARRPSGSVAVGMTLLLLLLLFEIFKHGIVRNDGHAGIFFIVAPVLALLIPVCFGEYRAQARGFAPLTVVLLLLTLANPLALYFLAPQMPFWLSHPARSLVLVLAPWRARRHLEAQYAELQRAWALPEVRRAVGDHPVDLLMAEQEAALLNSLRFRPRPVYQSYSAYSSALAELNADYYRGLNAPPFVLAEITTVDYHLPMQEDNRAWLELFRRYHPVLAERSLLLLARNDRPAEKETRRQAPPVARRVRLGEEVPIPADTPFHLLAIQSRGTLRQTLQSVLLRPGNLTLAVQDDMGHTTRYSLVLDTARRGFLLDPLITNTRDLVGLYSGQPLPHARSFHLESRSGKNFIWPMEITLTSMKQLVGQPINLQAANKMLAPGNWIAPQNPNSIAQSWGD
jgi:hypothetical protein